MALPRTWLQRAEEIVEVLRRMKAKHVDRSAIEELFQLQRRAAIDLMNSVGVSGDRRTGFLVDRTSLLAWTQKISHDESWQLRRRKETSDELSQSMAEVQAVRAAMDKEGKTPVSFPIVDQYLRATIASLPHSIRLERGLISIHVPEGAPEDMRLEACQLLYELAMAINNDPDRFLERITADSDTTGLASLRSIARALTDG
jgi:hypothetical protein